MSLQQQIQQDLTASMKARDAARTSALRMVLAAMKNLAVERGVGPQGALDDADVEGILGREIKRRREAADAFRNAGRAEQAAGEEAEAALYATYLPAPLSDDELAVIVDDAIAQTGAAGPQAMGQVMKIVMPQIGPEADGARVSALVRDRLAG